MEIPKSIESLKTLRFHESVLPYQEALDLLTEKTRNAAITNLASLAKWVDENRQDEEIVLQIEDQKNAIDEWLTPGGYSINQEELLGYYMASPNFTFSDAVEGFAHNIFPIFSRPHMNRDKGVVIIGYLLDFINIVDPDIASFEDAAVVVTQVLHKANIPPRLVGSMIDDAFHLSPGITDEVLIDTNDIARFTSVYLSTVTPLDRAEFKYGYEITRNELYINTFNRSLN